MPRHDPVSFCGHCRRQWPYDAIACQHCGSKLVVWDDASESEDAAMKKWKIRNGK
jgi:rRNA maturation endonuclease Nob1